MAICIPWTFNEAAPDDIQVAVDSGITICIRREDLNLVDGTEMDLVTEGLNSSLVFKNFRAQLLWLRREFCDERCGLYSVGFRYDETAATLARDASDRLDSNLQRRIVTSTATARRLVPTGDPITVRANHFVTPTQTRGQLYHNCRWQYGPGCR